MKKWWSYLFVNAVDYIHDYKAFDFGVVETSFKLEYNF